MKFKIAIPILYSADVSESLRFYTEVLGFDRKWDWGTPPSFGGVNKDGVEIFFCEKSQGNPGTWISLFMDQIDEFHDAIRAKGARILNPPETKDWGLREMLVEDPDGHIIRFSQAASMRKPGQEDFPENLRISARNPTIEEYRNLVSAVGWSTSSEEAVTTSILNAIIFSVLAEDTTNGQIVGCALLLGDHASFYYVKDVMVHPDWQMMDVGTELMKELTRWLDDNGADNALVGLYTGENLRPFYQQFGFKDAFGMSRRIRQPKK
jgi:catechol 2,3-dioxygenase-like lactoylglutathione lyase family enzyme/GNAT superfamily N-acetyltransferase